MGLAVHSLPSPGALKMMETNGGWKAEVRRVKY
jgi:hypothetical protein